MRVENLVMIKYAGGSSSSFLAPKCRRLAAKQRHSIEVEHINSLHFDLRTGLRVPQIFLCCPGSSSVEFILTDTPADFFSTSTSTQRPGGALNDARDVHNCILSVSEQFRTPDRLMHSEIWVQQVVSHSFYSLSLKAFEVRSEIWSTDF